MGLARDLTMGTTGTRRHRGAGRFPLEPAFTRAREMSRHVAHGGTLGPDQVRELREIVTYISSRPQRLRFEEGAIFNAACATYRHVTGEAIGPETGVL